MYGVNPNDVVGVSVDGVGVSMGTLMGVEVAANAVCDVALLDASGSESIPETGRVNSIAIQPRVLESGNAINPHLLSSLRARNVTFAPSVSRPRMFDVVLGSVRTRNTPLTNVLIPDESLVDRTFDIALSESDAGVDVAVGVRVAVGVAVGREVAVGSGVGAGSPA